MHCTLCNKFAFTTEAAAMVRAQQIADYERKPMRVYQCRLGGFHLTSTRRGGRGSINVYPKGGAIKGWKR